MMDKRLIDADALYDDVSRMGLTNGSALGRHSGMADVIAQMIQDAPTIDPESLRGHAKWVKDENVKIITVDAYGNTFESPAVYCENCNTALSEADFNGRVWNYCPVCGFIMEDTTNGQ